MADVEPIASKTFLDADSILKLKDLGERDVWVEKWQTYVRVRGMTAGERTEYSLALQETEKMPKDAQARMIQMCAMNADGNRMFQPKDIPQLSQKSAEALTPISEAIMELSGMRGDKEAEKN